jgi:hypothetical protein
MSILAMKAAAIFGSELDKLAQPQILGCGAWKLTAELNASATLSAELNSGMMIDTSGLIAPMKRSSSSIAAARLKRDGALSLSLHDGRRIVHVAEADHELVPHRLYREGACQLRPQVIGLAA